MVKGVCEAVRNMFRGRRKKEKNNPHMPQNRIRGIVKNILLLTIPSMIMLMLLLELVFSFVIPASDIPFLEYDKEAGLHQKPNQTGVWIKGINAEIKARYNFNSGGWNSIHDPYTADKKENVRRIIVIGDSYVEALQVNIEEAFPYVLEKRLNSHLSESNSKVEVYSLGCACYALSHYLNLTRYSMEKYKPDLVIISLVHNDFYNSLKKYEKIPYFIQFIEVNNSFIEVTPVIYKPSKIRRLLAKFSLFRYFYLNLDLTSKRSMSNLFKRKDQKIEGNMNISMISNNSLENEIRPLVNYVFSQLINVTEEYGSDLILIMDAARTNNKTGYINPKNPLNMLAREVSEQMEINFIDLTPYFISDYKNNGAKFEFRVDGHWNSYAHNLVAVILENYIVENDFLSIKNTKNLNDPAKK